MNDRLRKAKDLMSDDGVMFSSIDDNELYNLKNIFDSVFGSDNFMENLILKKSPNGIMSKNNIALQHEYVLLY
jgi:adenine-specific DNA-methyltransferase